MIRCNNLWDRCTDLHHAQGFERFLWDWNSYLLFHHAVTYDPSEFYSIVFTDRSNRHHTMIHSSSGRYSSHSSEGTGHGVGHSRVKSQSTRSCTVGSRWLEIFPANDRSSFQCDISFGVCSKDVTLVGFQSLQDANAISVVYRVPSPSCLKHGYGRAGFDSLPKRLFW